MTRYACISWKALERTIVADLLIESVSYIYEVRINAGILQ